MKKPTPTKTNSDLFVPTVKNVEKWLDSYYLNMLVAQVRRDG